MRENDKDPFARESPLHYRNFPIIIRSLRKGVSNMANTPEVVQLEASPQPAWERSPADRRSPRRWRM